MDTAASRLARLASNMSSETYLSPEELADRFGVPLQTVYGWNKQTSGPPYMKLGRHVRYKLSDVLAWEQSRMVLTRDSLAR